MATTHFSDLELRIADTPPEFRANAQRVGALLEQLRAFIAELNHGVPVRLRITDLFTSSIAGASIVGRVKRSCHETASGVDIVPLDPAPGLIQIARAMADQLPFPFGEFIVYPFDGHMHITLPGCGGNNQVLVALAEGGFSPLTTRRGQVNLIVLLILIPLLFFLLRRMS